MDRQRSDRDAHIEVSWLSRASISKVSTEPEGAPTEDREHLPDQPSHDGVRGPDCRRDVAATCAMLSA
jgi:hypothetical protein